jgi:two-component system chemotaxis sensor kinase CheA
MIRLVRDVAQKTGKKVDLDIVGEETEVDRNVIEKITDPLVHVIRNAIDHGIGEPAARQKAGKSPAGRILLSARYVGGEVWITINDDGKGLNREKILAKAQERGLVAGRISDLTNSEVWDLIFQPGFSTVDTITDVSGRGVGMDVVRRNIEAIGGKVGISSQEGKGTQVDLKIPLTLAIIDGMIVRVGNQKYTIPITAIKETMRVDDRLITRTMDGQEIINVRDSLFPVIRLHEFYNVEPQNLDLPDGIIMIVENSGRRFCLFVDELIGQQQIVIKGLSRYVGNLKAISGCTILGDGTVCLIVDVGGLADLVGNTTDLTGEPGGVECQ